MKLLNLLPVISAFCLSIASQADTTPLQMSGSITDGTTLSASVLLVATNHFFTCESKNAGGWLAPKTSSVTAQVKIEDGKYTLNADVNSGFCEYKIASIELYVHPANSKLSDLQTISVDSPLAGVAGYDDLSKVSGLACQTAQSSTSGFGLSCAVVKADGTPSTTDQMTVLSSELNAIRLDIAAQN